MSWPDPAALSSLLTHLSNYGELYSAELDWAAQRWLPLLDEAGWVRPLTGGAYATTNAYLALAADLPESECLRRVCFAIPVYRRYLVAVLAEGLVNAGQLHGYHERLEQWVAHDLTGIAREINMLLDELEAGQGRMVEWPSERITTCFADWHAQCESFAHWDRVLLGLSGASAHLFTAVMGHADAFSTHRPAMILGDRPVALLPGFELTKDTGGHLALPPHVIWSTGRQLVHSSLPFFDARSKPLYDATQPVPLIWQDVLAQQPYYRAVLRTGIAVRLSDYVPNALTLLVSDDLGDTRVLVGGRERGALVELLPDLVATMGYRALCKPSPARVGCILEHWIAVGAFVVRNGRVLLQESYARTLHERRRATLLLRGSAREEQVRIDKYLKEMT